MCCRPREAGCWLYVEGKGKRQVWLLGVRSSSESWSWRGWRRLGELERRRQTGKGGDGLRWSAVVKGKKREVVGAEEMATSGWRGSEGAGKKGRSG